jgi:mRNA interferase RelE/StbE
MDLVFDKVAMKVLRKMQPKAATAMMDRLEAIAADPLKPHPNVTAMQGMTNAFRLRQGDWRAVYELDRKASVIRVVKIGQRGQVYR